MPGKRGWGLVIDRIEGDVAVVEEGKGAFREVPVSSIGGRARDGAVVRETPGGGMEVDEEATERRGSRVADKARSLFRR